MSKLAALAKQRAEAKLNLPSDVDRKESKLASLSHLRASQQNDEDPSVIRSVAILNKLNILSHSPSLASGNGSKLSKISIGTKLNKLKPKPTKEDLPEKSIIAAKKPEKQVFSCSILYDDSILMQLPQNEVSVFFFNKRTANDDNENRKKRRRHDDDLFQTLTNLELNVDKIAKAKKNFSSPSPDDKILEAQKSAFEEGLNNLKIADRKKSPSPVTKPTKKIDLQQALKTSYTKPHKSFVVIGHVDAGKSTLMGRMLFDYGIIDAKTVNKLVKEAERAGKGSFALAWIMDQTADERKHGVTIDICATDFETTNVKFTAIDSPGHKDFVPQMIGGVSQADFAVLVADSITGEFESGFAMDGQTKEHTILAKSLGIEKLVVVVNKMDKEGWNQDRFEFIKEQLSEYLSNVVGFKEENLSFIPISGLTGNNVVKRDSSIAAFEWYKGPTLGDFLENVSVENSKDITQDFVLSVHDSFKDKGEIKVSGKISSGVIQVGETILSLPTEISLQVQGIKVADKPVDFAIGGELVQLSFKANQLENDKEEPFRIGDLITKAGSPIQCAKKITVDLNLFGLTKPLLVGSPVVLFRNNSQVPARLSKLIEVKSDKKKKKKMLHLLSNQRAIVEIEIEGQKLPITKYLDNKSLGRIVIRREGLTLGAGTVEEVSL